MDKHHEIPKSARDNLIDEQKSNTNEDTKKVWISMKPK